MFPTPFKISTITATGSVNTLIDLPLFFENVDISAIPVSSPSIVYIECSKEKENNIEILHRGYNPMIKAVNKKKKLSKCFDNQVTCIITLNGINYVNVKVFKNGKIQMTGLKHVDQGKSIIDCVIENLKKIYTQNVSNIVEIFCNLLNTEYKVQLINSDFKVGIEIRREKLNKIIQNTYGVLSSFEPCIYPGVKIQFFWKKRFTKHDGICQCSEYCDGRGDSKCKKITIAVFQSGCIIITGAQTVTQIKDAYEFICDVIKTHKNEIQMIKMKSSSIELI
jgi:TATA-box binding protein (TBP) (component of TFIID and TFIIIB)